ncbi:MAG: AsmA family protein [Planctomycetota bacterium]
MKSTRWKKVGIVLAVLLVVVIAAALIIPQFFDLNRYNELITSELEKAMGGTVTLGPLSWGISNGVWLKVDGFTSKGATAFPGELDLSRIYAKVSILPLLSKKVVVDKLLLDKPVVEVNLAPSPPEGKKAATKPGSEKSEKPTTEDAPTPSDGQTSRSSPLPVEIRIEELKVDKGRIRLSDSLTLPGQKTVYNFADVLIQATNLAPGKKIGFKLALRDEATPGLGSVKGQGTFTGLTEALTVENPELDLKVTLADLNVDTLKPYLKNKSLAQRLGGSISLDVNYKGDFGENLRAEGHLDLSDFTYTDTSLWETALPGVETRITYQITLEPEQIKVEKLDVNLGKISLSAAALLQDWQNKPIIKDGVLSLELPVTELIPLVPWKKLGEEAKVIRQSLAGGGKVVVEKMALRELPLAQLPEKWKTLLSGAEGSIRLSDMSAGLSPELPKLDDITGTLRLEKGVLTATKVQARMGPLTLPMLEARATNLTGKVKVSAAAKGPMRLEGTEDAEVEKLLRQYGLKSLSGSGEIDLRADYDQATPRQWYAGGSLVLKGVKAVSHPAGARLDDLQGRVTVKRTKTLEITVENLMARLNQSPLQLEGKLSGGGTPQLVVDGKARTERLDLKQLSGLFPPLKDLELAGILDMNIDVHYPHADPGKSKFSGTVKTRGIGLRLAAHNLTITEGDGDIELAGDTVILKDMTLKANDQKMSLSGQVTNFREPTARLQAKSANLNVDRLLVPAKSTGTEAKPSSKPPAEKEGTPKSGEPAKTEEPAKKKAGKSELPPLLRKLTAQVQAEATRGQYRGQEFQNFTFRADYERGVLKSHEFDVLIGGGSIQTKGSADLRNLERIPFTVEPDISAVRLESIASLLDTDKISVQAPLTMTGRLQARTGSKKDLLASLRGNLEAEAGPGRIPDIGPVGNTLFKILAFVNLQQMFSGKKLDDMAEKGIPFDSLTYQATFQDGTMDVNKLRLLSPALHLDADGNVYLVKQRLDMKAHIELLGTLDKVLDLVPVLGKAAGKLTNVYLHLEGPLEDPKIRVRPAKGITKAGKKGTQDTGKAAEDVIKEFGKGLEKIFGK